MVIFLAKQSEKLTEAQQDWISFLLELLVDFPICIKAQKIQARSTS